MAPPPDRVRVPEELLTAVLNRRYSVPVAVTSRRPDPAADPAADLAADPSAEPPRKEESGQQQWAPARPRLAVLGAGDYGRAFATRAVRSGYQVALGSRNPNKK